MGAHTIREIRIKGAQRRQHFGATIRVRIDRAALCRGQRRVIVNDVEQRLVNFADVVEERDPLDAPALFFIQIGGAGEHQRVACDAADVRPRHRIVGVDGVEQRLERRGAEAFEMRRGATFVPEECTRGGSRGRGQVRRGRSRSSHVLRLGQESCTLRVMSSPVHRPIAVVSRKGAQRWSGGHPWIYRSDVTERPEAPAGIVTVHDSRGKPLGTALWSPVSEISLRLIDPNPDARIDQGWWEGRIENAARRRAPLHEVTNAYRIVHGEGDGLPSLVVDRYDDSLVIQLMSAGVDACAPDILAALHRVLAPSGILARNDASLRAKEGLPRETSLLQGDVPREIEVVEYGVKYIAAPWTGQKTGAFLDQRDNRHMIGSVARGRALDCFSYHGSFALHVAQRATSVTALDISAPALERARENAARNGSDNIDFVEADAFDFLRDRERDGTRYDTIVLDPPAFAKTRPSLPGALRGYKDVNLRAMRLLAPGGMLFTASCSFHLTKPLFLDMLQAAAADSGRRIVLRAMTGQSLDHPEVLTIPETGYIKGALLEAID